jgi:nitrous oxide reductase accessory protein NosL
MKKSLAAAGIALALVLAGCGAGESPKQTDRIEEDEAGWDCRTMGNRVCGEDLPKGVVLVNPDDCPLYVTACYDHLTPWAKGK